MSGAIPSTPETVAIVGMAGRFPRARNLEEFWRNLRSGRECVSFFDDDQVQWLPIEHRPDLGDPRFVKARAVLEGAEWFDASFFGLNPREAAVMDPQHRVFLECAWEALEDAGCVPDTYPGLIGVFAGASMNTYLLTNLLTNPGLVKEFGVFSSMILNDGDFLPTRVSYKLNLRGPSLNVQTACSTSLVAVCLAVQSLLTYRCDVALAGGVSITFPPNRGQHHLEGGILSHDGHCRAFDARATGTVLGDGAGVVVLKRLSEAIAEGDRIHAVILGNAINNDGAVKIGYTAPSIDGQAECIAMAQAEAGVEPSSVSYVEAHGTGTPLGDPIEIAGLSKAFGVKEGPPDGNGGIAKTCAIGSVKTNIGHLDIAAGVAGLIKTVLALRHGEIPPSLHFASANPQLGIERTPFRVNAELRPWARGPQPRRAGVSSFGIGGTNAHVVLEEAPATGAPERSPRPRHLLVLSAKTAHALDAAAENLAAHFSAHPGLEPADVAHALQTRRKAFAHRGFVVADSIGAAASALRQPLDRPLPGDAPHEGRRTEATAPSIVFMFPGQGAQVVGMGAGLYAHAPGFREAFDRCSMLLEPRIGTDLRALLFPRDAGRAAEAARLLAQTRFTQPALFAVEYALARVFMRHGVQPDAMIGHSLGEYVAACVAGVFSLEDALSIIAERARLMQRQPEGAMVAVRLAEDRVLELLSPSLSLAAINARGLCVVSGPFDAITAFETKLGESGVASRRLTTSHPFHSAGMDPVVRPFADYVARFPRNRPRIRFVSNLTGTWITDAQATDPGYWAAQTRGTVRFRDGAALLADDPARRVLVELGPGETLCGLVRQAGSTKGAVDAIPALGRGTSPEAGYEAFVRAIGRIWAAGLDIDWKPFHAGEGRRHVDLPTYPFERKRHWIEPGPGFPASGSTLGDVADGHRAHAGTDLAAPPPKAGPEESRGKPPDGAAAPDRESSTLRPLRELFEELSGCEIASTDPSASFHQLGFDSLFLTQASLAVSKRFGVDVTFRELRDRFHSLRTLSDHLDAARNRDAAPAGGPDARDSDDASHAVQPNFQARNPGRAGGLPPLAAAPAVPDRRREQILPASDAQREIWFATQLGNDVSPAFNESSSIELRGALDGDALRRAFRKLVDRHDALRTTILPRGERQRIAAEGARELSFSELAAGDPAACDRALRARIAEEVERAFDLTGGPLFRADLIRVEPGRHVLLLVVHHIVCDGWSLGILVKDLADLYTAETRAGAEPPPPPPALAPYFERQRAYRESSRLDADEKYWDGQFSDGAPVLDLPGDRPRPAERTYAGATRVHALSPELTSRLRQTCARRDCTLFTLLLAAFEALLSRLAGRNDLVVGVPAAAQVMDGFENLAGHFANLLPVRCRIGETATFADLIIETRGKLADALEHCRFPFGRLLQRAGGARDGSRLPLANVVFNSTRLRGNVRFGPIAAVVTGNPRRFSYFDLNVNFAVSEDAVSLGATYSTELFDDSTIARWFGHFETLLDAAVADPDVPVARLPLMRGDELRRILFDWNDRPLPYDRNAVVRDLFRAQAARTPDAVALVAKSRRTTYGELDRESDALAERLRQAGVGADTLAGVFLERTPGLVTAILGILKAGGAYVPLDPAYPAERLEYIVADSGVELLVTDRHLAERSPATRCKCVLIDATSAKPAGGAPRAPAAESAPPTPNSLAYVMYTSGSTGRPKGVALVQRCIVALVAWARHAYSAEELCGVLFSTSASFDLSVFEIFCPLCLGGKIVMADNILEVGTLPAAGEIRFLSGVPSALAEIVRLGIVPDSVTTVALAGETFPQKLVDALYGLPRMRRVFELYGPTEATVYSTGSLRRRGTHPTLGVPFPNEQVYILDRRLQPVPIGVTGEICIGGDKLARGYLNRPELTAEKFVRNPFRPEAGETREAGSQAVENRAGAVPVDHRPEGNAGGARLYRTGDLGQWRPDGTIEFAGRADHQVKVRGFRVEPAEIESAIVEHPLVAECAVLARPDPSGNNRLSAYVVPRAGCGIDAADVRAHLARRLPAYMVPTAMVVLERCPRLPNGKLDRNALPDPLNAEAIPDSVAPRTATEELIAEIWREVLGSGRIGVNDNFFEAGGHSLLATQVIARLQESLGVELTLREYFATPTIAGLAGAVDATLIREIKGMPGSADVATDALATVEGGS